MNIDFLVVGAGLYGATIARLLTNNNYKCLIIDKRNHLAGNIYSERSVYGYDIHMYGPHIFHTDNDDVIDFVNKFAKWRQYNLNIIATDGNKLYHLPFNMNTYYDMFDVSLPIDAQHIISQEIEKYGVANPSNLEEQAISMVGKTIYETLIKHYTEKQWNKSCIDLDKDIIKRLPLRYSFDNNYYNDKFQTIPVDGYTKFITNIISNIPYMLNIEFDYSYWKDKAKHIIYCGAVDELLDYKLGELEWRSLKFEHNTYIYNGYNGQGSAIKNYTDERPYTRTIEHMWFTPHLVKNNIESIITTEYPDNWERNKERYYAVNNKKTEFLYNKYVELLKQEMPNISLGGRLGKYKYFDMDDTIAEAMKDSLYFLNIV